jgi:hypothetical protein
MLQTTIHRIRPDQEWRLREWLTMLNTRPDEVRESLAASGVRAEQAFIIAGATGPLLVYVSEAEHTGYAADAYRRSNLPVDVEHRQVMDECLAEPVHETPVYDIAL